MENNFELTDEMMEKVNQFTRRGLSKDEIYAFPVLLCDNEVDRDNERFSIAALHKMAELFIGKKFRLVVQLAKTSVQFVVLI